MDDGWGGGGGDEGKLSHQMRKALTVPEPLGSELITAGCQYLHYRFSIVLYQHH